MKVIHYVCVLAGRQMLLKKEIIVTIDCQRLHALKGHYTHFIASSRYCDEDAHIAATVIIIRHYNIIVIQHI